MSVKHAMNGVCCLPVWGIRTSWGYCGGGPVVVVLWWWSCGGGPLSTVAGWSTVSEAGVLSTVPLEYMALRVIQIYDK